MEKIYRIDLSKQTVKIEDVPEEYKRLGGRGLTSKVIYDEVNPECHPLSGDNKLVIAPGLISGTTLSSTNRLSIGSKSLLTGGIKECNSGGTVAYKLARLGIKAIILEGKPKNDDGSWKILNINNENITIEDGSFLSGTNAHEGVSELFERYPKKAGFMVIGPAGEMKLPVATINVTDTDGEPCRILARGGLGAVMGSKGIKAIVINDSKVKTDNSPEYRDFFKKYTDEIMNNEVTGDLFPKYGTARTLAIVNKLGGLPTRNYSQGTFEDADKIDGYALYDLLKSRKNGMPSHNCMPGCLIRCSNRYVNEEGELITSSLEYETLCLLGSNLGIGDLDKIAVLNRLCNDCGIDTMEVGVALGVLGEAGVFEFGNFEDVKRIIEEIGEGTALGRLVGSGSTICGKVYGIERVPAVKNQGMAAYDPRAIKGNGVTYATSPMGADHTAGNTIVANVDHLEAEGKIDVSRKIQTKTVVLDSLGICIFTGRVTMQKPEIVEEMVKVVSGWDVTFEELEELGEKVINWEREFNNKAGISDKHDNLPEFFKKEKLPPNDSVFDIEGEDLQKTFSKK